MASQKFMAATTALCLSCEGVPHNMNQVLWRKRSAPENMAYYVTFKLIQHCPEPPCYQCIFLFYLFSLLKRISKLLCNIFVLLSYKKIIHNHRKHQIQVSAPHTVLSTLKGNLVKFQKIPHKRPIVWWL